MTWTKWPFRIVLLGTVLLSGCELLSSSGETTSQQVQVDERLIPDSVLAAYRQDAAYLAVRTLHTDPVARITQVELPDTLLDAYLQALLHVYLARSIKAREAVVERYQIHAHASPAIHSLAVSPNPNATWAQAWWEGRSLTGNAAVDALMNAYNLTVENYHEFLNGRRVAALRTSHALNIEALALRFEDLADIGYAEPNGIVGDGNNIAGNLLPDRLQLTYSVGFGDCPSGCIDRHYWTFEVTSDGLVTLVEETGAPLPY